MLPQLQAQHIKRLLQTLSLLSPMHLKQLRSLVSCVHANPADAQFAKELLRCGIRIFPGIVGLTSERIVEHYGRWGQNHGLIVHKRGEYIFWGFECYKQ